MEASGRISEEWSSLSGLYTAEEADFMNQLLGNCSVPEEELLYENSTLGFPCAFWPAHESTVVSVTGINNNPLSYFPSNDANKAHFFSFSQGCSSSTDSGVSCYGLNDRLTNFDSVAMDFSLGDAKIVPYSVQGNDLLSHINDNTDEESGLDPVRRVVAVTDKKFQANNGECQELVSPEPAENGKSTNLKKSEKRSRSSSEIQKNKRNVKSKNTKSESISRNEEDRSFQRQSSSSCCSEDDSNNASQDLNVGSTSSLNPKDSASPKSNGKSTSAKNPATDPQSVYARRRRERINERLRILQNLVPNGTKVDISTMLEEAVQYVKFLQLQIKLLSSDDLWMYAPIAYNGLNIGLDFNITPTKQS